MPRNDNKLNIAVLATAKVAFPLKGNDPMRFFSPLKVALNLADGLARRGHRITFFGPKGSRSDIFDVIEAPIKPIYENKKLLAMEGIDDPELAKKDKEKMLVLLEQYLAAFFFKECQKRKFDLLHIHAPNESLPFGFLSLTESPAVYTLHDAIFPWRNEVFRMFQTDRQHFVSISNAQRKTAPSLNWAGTAYNGIDLNLFPFYERAEGGFLFLGRLLPRKGVAEAIKAANATKSDLTIVGAPNKGKFWETCIKPEREKANIRYSGFVPYEKTHIYYGKAKALLCPIRWEEPFGLTFIEAMACGTPVIAFRRGAAPEVIKDGKTGFLVNSVSEMESAMKNIGRINRKDCRQWVEKKFTTEKMVDQYEKIYYKILGKERARQPR